jgi:UDP-N-acetylglucosamine 2-epimerase
MKLVTVVGNRPQLVKAAPLSLALRDAGIDEVVVHTGQHWDDELSQVFIDELGLDEPRYRLDLRTADVARLSPAIRGVLEDERPDLMMVLGDTNSTLAGARAACLGMQQMQELQAYDIQTLHESLPA